MGRVMVAAEEFNVDSLALYVLDYLKIPIAYVMGFVNYRGFFRANKVRTKKTHICEKCREEIPAGSEVYAVVFTKGARMFTVYYHADCYRKEVERVKQALSKTVDTVMLEYAEEGKDIFGRRGA